MPISIPVMTTRIKKIMTYLNGVGCFVTSPGSGPGGACSVPPISACVTAESSCSSVLTVPSDFSVSSGSLTSVSSLISSAPHDRSVVRLGHEVHDREDHDPHHVDEVPVEAGDLHRLRLLRRQAV